MREFARLFPEVYERFARRWGPGEYRPSHEANAILQHLAGAGPLTVTEAAAHFDRSQAATSELVNRLQARGLVDRIPDERDQRRHLVWLTERGREMAATARSVLEPERLAAAFERLADAERRQLLSGMRALIRAAREIRNQTQSEE